MNMQIKIAAELAFLSNGTCHFLLEKTMRIRFQPPFAPDNAGFDIAIMIGATAAYAGLIVGVVLVHLLS